MDDQVFGDKLEPIYNSSKLIQDVVLKTYRKRWTIETNWERWLGKSVLAVHDDDDAMQKKTESLSENEVYEILLNFEIQTDPLIPTRRPELLDVNKGKNEFVISWIFLFERTAE